MADYKFKIYKFRLDAEVCVPDDGNALTEAEVRAALVATRGGGWAVADARVPHKRTGDLRVHEATCTDVEYR